MTKLIFGGDSRLAKAMLENHQNGDPNLLLTTRRPIILNSGKIYCCFSELEKFVVPEDIKSAAIVGGPVSYSECSDNYDVSFHINCIAIPSLVLRLLSAGIFVTFLSSNRVFNYKEPMTEYGVPNPSFPYSIMKAKAEEIIQNTAQKYGYQDRLAILRLTKNVNFETAPFQIWAELIRQKKEIPAFHDLFFSPILFKHSAKLLKQIMENEIPGIFHLSGEKDLNYYEFACGLINYLGLPFNNVKSIKSSDSGVTLLDNYPVTSLKMARTTQIFNISPVSVDEIYFYLRSNIY